MPEIKAPSPRAVRQFAAASVLLRGAHVAYFTTAHIEPILPGYRHTGSFLGRLADRCARHALGQK
jgi:hypothetical protein